MPTADIAWWSISAPAMGAADAVWCWSKRCRSASFSTGWPPYSSRSIADRAARKAITASAGAAGQGFAGAALEYAQFHVAAVEHLQEAGVDALRKARMVFDLRTGFKYRGRIDVADHLHRMRIAHRYHRHQHGLVRAVLG